MKTKILILYVYGISAAACFMMYFAPSDPAAGGIPEEAIRIRVVAHDNSKQEQERKERVHLAVADQISSWAGEAHSPEDARLLVKENINEIKQSASEAAGEHVQVTLGKEAFPAKQYGRYVYPPGEYESLVVTIGAGRGDNWWCLLYPSFCFPEEGEEERVIEEDTVEAAEVVTEEEAEEGAESGEDDSEYKWAVVELWDHLRNDNHQEKGGYSDNREIRIAN
ncbi:stage II sporulation protein R [Domibacillus indicus]|uniref:stage II sporulation protein R n=1 Tax=Domibacillus indicus TaxID=1437523 RepID=UPI000697C2B6|nr:stage II sporulation protein R [Domibacillus indicus]